jgi:hypothetical protein
MFVYLSFFIGYRRFYHSIQRKALSYFLKVTALLSQTKVLKISNKAASNLICTPSSRQYKK